MKKANPILSRLLTCQNITMAQFAEELQNLAPDYIYTPVADGTELGGAWDFTLNFSAAFLLQSGEGQSANLGQPTGAAPATSDPNGALSLFDAVTKQLGLKLQMKKRPMPVLIIDHIEEKPADN